ncbi:MAG: transglycosylase SLT domain-containing protein [Candidatus Sumerlaeota bacterium]|nr:transglycosylase SLT domain-containing protein [Candidatus Sumerlaeota bacterium]
MGSINARRVEFVVALAAASLAAPLRADTIFLKNGQRIEGHILDDSKGRYLVEAGPTTFQLSSQMIDRVIKYTHRDTSLVLLGDSFLRSNDYAQARRYYQRALAETEHKEVVLARLKLADEMVFRSKDLSQADGAFQKGDYRLSADLYMGMLASHPDDAFTQEIKRRASEAYCALAKDYCDKGREDDAVFELRHAMQMNPLSARAHAVAGRLLARQGKYAPAGEEYRLALDLDKTEALAIEGLKALGQNPAEILRAAADRGGPAGPGSVLTDLFGSDGLYGRADQVRYAALMRRDKRAPAVHFNLAALRTASFAETGQTRFPYYRFRDDEALSIFLQAYNAGPAAVSLYDGAVPYQETIQYVQRVKDAIDAIAIGKVGKTRYDDLIAKYAQMFGLSPILVKAIVKVESDFNPQCVSRADARGLIQLVRVDWEDSMKRLGLDADFDKNVFDPEKNLYVGCLYLRWLVDEYLPKNFKEHFG